MKISGLQIDRFGIWSGVRFDGLADGVNVFYGPNEAGKTTLMQFIRMVLYGFGSGRAERYLKTVGHGLLSTGNRVGGNVSASPVFAGGRIYVTTEDGKTVALKAGTKSRVLAESDLKERVFASMAVVGNTIFCRTEEHLYRIEER